MGKVEVFSLLLIKGDDLAASASEDVAGRTTCDDVAGAVQWHVHVSILC